MGHVILLLQLQNKSMGSTKHVHGVQNHSHMERSHPFCFASFSIF